MSDEPEPPALRLRPRKKPAADTPPAESADPGAATPEAAPEPGSGAAETPKLTLRPASQPGAPAEAVPAQAPADSPAQDSSKVRPKPRLSLKGDTKEEPTSQPAAPAAPAEPAAPVPPPSPSAPLPPAADQPEATPTKAKPKLSLKGEPSAEPASSAPSASVGPPSPSAPPPPPSPEMDTPGGSSPVDLPPAKPEKPKLKLSWAKPDSTEPVGEGTPAEDAASDTTPPPPSKPISMSRPPMARPQVTSIESSLGEASSTMPPFVPMDGGSSTPPPSPSGAPAYPPPPGLAGGPGAGLPPPMPGAAARVDDDDDDVVPARKRLDQRPLFKLTVIAVVLLVVGALGYGAWFAYSLFFGADDPAPVAETPAVPAPTPASTETAATPAAEGPRSTAGQMIDRARQAAGAHDEVAEATDEASGASAAPAEEPPVATSRVTITEAPVAAAPSQVEPTPEFLAWVSAARISGVREGESPRAFVNGILVQKGDTIDAQLGIRFDGVDARRNLLIFKDETGAVVGKKY